MTEQLCDSEYQEGTTAHGCGLKVNHKGRHESFSLTWTDSD